MTVSVCMAAYNGALYIEEQIASILPQLTSSDEIVIVDDASEDDTVRILGSFHDDRIKLLQNEQNRGVIKSFERALGSASGDLIFLSDQDDLWSPNKVAIFQQFFAANPTVTLALSAARIIDGRNQEISASWTGAEGFHPGLVRNFVRNRYLGCAMAFRKGVLQVCLPFPPKVPMHDMWIGLTNEIFGKTGFIDEPLLSYRRHGGNATPGKHAAVRQMLRWRWNLATSLIARAISIQARASLPSNAG